MIEVTGGFMESLEQYQLVQASSTHLLFCQDKSSARIILEPQETCLYKKNDEVSKQELSMEVLQCEIDFHMQHIIIASFIGLKILACTIND